MEMTTSAPKRYFIITYGWLKSFIGRHFNGSSLSGFKWSTKVNSSTFSLRVAAIVSLLAFGYGETLLAVPPVPGGLIRIELSGLEISPTCLKAHAGGQTGPGSGITIRNDCPTTFNVMTIQEVGKEEPAQGYDVYVFTDPSRSTPWAHWNKSSTLRVRHDFPVCKQLLPADKVMWRNCQNVILPPHSEMLIFVWGSFLIEGTNEMKVSGKILPRTP